MEDNDGLIAKFVGFTYEKNLGWYDNDMLLEQIVYDQQNGNCFDELLFDKSWDWLMPVVEKIESIDNCGVDIFFGSVEIYKDGQTIIKENTKHKTKIQSVYNACLEFIKWYNLNSKKEE